MKGKLMMLLACLFMGASLVTAQTSKVTGLVVSAEDNEPVIGATITVKGVPTLGAITDVAGKFVIENLPSSAKTLIVSYVGMTTQEVTVHPYVKVTMQSDEEVLAEVVVTAAGIQRTERSLGYSLTKIDADEALQKAEPDMLRALDGKIAGVQVSAPTGDAGSATRITIRGNSSFTGNNQPLYVVDGVPYSNSGTSASGRGAEGSGSYGSGISTLDPNDIESMSVLKGAAAAVLYGSRAANGVILITTKSGSKQKKDKKGIEVTFNGSYATETVASLPDYQNTYGQGYDFLFSGSNGSWGPAFTEGATMPMYSEIAKYYPDLALQLYPNLNGEIPYQAYPNNVKDLFDTGSIWDGSVNIQSSNDRGNFNVTVSRTAQDSYIPGSEFDRYSFSVGGNSRLSNGIRVGGNMSYAFTDQTGSMYGNNQSNSELGGLSSLARAFIMPRSWDIQNFPYQTPDGDNLLFQLSSQANNPYWAWENDYIQSAQKRFVANVNAGYDFTKWLSLDYNLGLNDYTLDRKKIIDLGSRGYAGKGYISRGISNIEEWESTLLLSANKRLGDFGLKATLGHNYNQYTSNSLSASGLEIVNSDIYAIDNTKSQVAAEGFSKKRKWGLFADILLDYKSWAFLNLSGRNDISSTLPIENNSFFYPAVSGSLVFTEALGIQDGFLNFGKLRASWAKVGNDAGPYYNNGTYSIGSPYMGQGLMELPTLLYDPLLEPEFTEEVETGLELKFFGGRVGLDATYYDRISDNQIGQKSLPASSGYSSYITNFGSIRNSGFEVGLDLVPVMTRDFKWNMYATFTKNQSEVLSLADGVDKIYIGGDFTTPRPVLMVGQPYGVLEGEMIARDENGTPLVDPASGMYINSTETGIIGDPNPDFKASLMNTLAYKNWSLSFMLDFQKGGCVYSTYLTDLLGRGVTKDTEDRLGTRILPGVYGDPNTGTPLLDADGNKIPNTTALQEADLWFSSGTYSTFAINSVDEMACYDATVLRLREVTLNYSFPKKWMQKMKLTAMDLSLVGRNLWFFAPNVPKHSGYDPTSNSYGETNVQGIDYTSAPATRRIAANVRITF